MLKHVFHVTTVCVFEDDIEGFRPIRALTLEAAMIMYECFYARIVLAAEMLIGIRFAVVGVDLMFMISLEY